VTAVGVGTATITATSDMVEEIVAECDVTVAVFVTGVTLDQETLALTFGGVDGTLTATIAPVTATDKTLIWISSNEEVATVEGGVVTAVSGGTATITAITTDGGFMAECEVTVSVPVTGITLDEEILTLQANGATGTLVATIAPITATNKNVTWTSSAETYATVEDGVVTPLAIGGAIITATTEDGGFTDTCNIIVTISVNGVTLDQDTLSLIEGGEVGTLIATVTPIDAVITDVTWASSKEAVATVLNGVVTPLTAGTTTITATTVDGEFTDTCAVTVTGAE
ncbi:Ig-like domain-containing protein, partial [Methanoculleus sp.]|uniref:Ig-like domain-containing protein n=1 Tax=Methanoculleus sp. TaxID=90427 RepID=UPI0025CDA8E4